MNIIKISAYIDDIHIWTTYAEKQALAGRDVRVYYGVYVVCVVE